MDDEYRPFISRQRDIEPRVHTELNRRSRERLASITQRLTNYQDRAFSELTDQVGYTEVNSVSSSHNHQEFIMNADTELVLTYLEFLLNELIDSVLDSSYRGSIPKGFVREAIEKVDNVLVSEGLLFELEVARDWVQFHPMESQAMEEVDGEIQALAEEEPWDEALKGYNDAFQRWKNGDYDEIIPKKLYNSIEEVLKTICVDLEGWTEERERTHKFYLDILNERGVYDAHGVTAPELNDLLNSMERMVSKVSDDRHQRHAYHDRTYSTLLLHQVGAYIYFLISRYESFSDNL